MEIDFPDLGRLLWRRKLPLVLAAVIGAAGAFFISKAMPVVYTSEALVEVQSRPAIGNEANAVAPAITPGKVRTEADIISSRALSAEVVHGLGLVDNPALKAEPRPPTWIDRTNLWLRDAKRYIETLAGIVPKEDPVAKAVKLFQRRLQVSTNEKSNIVTVRFTAGTPMLAADIANDLVKTYMTSQVDANQQVNAQESQWLTQHLQKLQNDVDDAEHKVEAFRAANGLLNIQAGALSAIQLSQNEQALAVAEQDLARAQAAYATATQPHSGNFSGQEALSSQLIQRLREREAEAAQRYANMKNRFGESSSFLGAPRAEMNSLNQQIARESSKIVASLHRDLTVAQDRVASLQRMVDQSSARAQKSVAAAAGLAELKQAADARRHVYTAFLTRMEQTELASAQSPSARLVSAAVPPDKSDGLPNTIVAPFGAAIGLFVMLTWYFFRFLMVGKVTSGRDLVALTDVELAGSIPALPGRRGMSVPMRILDMAPNGMVETLRALRLTVQSMNPGATCTRVLVSSSEANEGKSTLAASLARLSAADGLRVLLIEADLRRPRLAGMLSAKPPHSLEALLDREVSLTQALHIDPKSGLHCLLSGGRSANPTMLLQSPAFRSLMLQVRIDYDMVIIDGPPIMRVVDPIVLSAYSDAVLFAVAWERTPRALVAEALRRFPANKRSQIATVLTRVPQTQIEWQGYYGGYANPLVASS